MLSPTQELSLAIAGAQTAAECGQGVGRRWACPITYTPAAAPSPEHALAPPARPWLPQASPRNRPACLTGRGGQGLIPLLPTHSSPRPQASNRVLLRPPTLKVGEISAHLPSWENVKGTEKGGAGWRRRRRLFPFVRLHRGGNEVIMLLMGRDKQADQCVSTIAEQEGLEKWWQAAGLRVGGLCPGASRVSWGLLGLGAYGHMPTSRSLSPS